MGNCKSNGYCNGDFNFCSSSYPCGEDEGDCDSSSDCNYGLNCGSDNCPSHLGFDSSVDCCIPGFPPPSKFIMRLSKISVDLKQSKALVYVIVRP